MGRLPGFGDYLSVIDAWATLNITGYRINTKQMHFWCQMGDVTLKWARVSLQSRVDGTGFGEDMEGGGFRVRDSLIGI